MYWLRPNYNTPSGISPAELMFARKVKLVENHKQLIKATPILSRSVTKYYLEHIRIERKP